MELHIPRWQELPEIGLYMDQVVLVLNKVLQPICADQTPPVTATMINNYVKMKLTQPPEKKKYSREHLAWFLMICLLKKVFSLQEITALQRRFTEQAPLDCVYDRFCRELEHSLQEKEELREARCPLLMATALQTVACKIRVEQLLKENEKTAEVFS